MSKYYTSKWRGYVSTFLAGRTEDVFEGEVSSKALYEAWLAWCKERNIPPKNHIALGLEITARGYEEVGKRKGNVYLGLRLKEN